MMALSKVNAGEPPTLWRAFAGFGIWAVCFTVLYTGHALGCTLFVAPSGDAMTYSPVVMNRLTWLLAGTWMVFVCWLAYMSLRSAVRVRSVDQHLRKKRTVSDAEGLMLNGDGKKRSVGTSTWNLVRCRSLRFMVILTFVADASSVVITVTVGLPIVLTPVCA